MYWVDILAILISLVLIYKSYQQGLLSSAFRLAGLIIGIIVAANLGSWASDIFIMQFGWSQQLAQIVGYVAIFVIVIILAQIVAYFLRTIIHAVKLGWLDKIGGLLLGGLKAALIMSLIFLLLLAVPTDSLGKDIKEKSFSYKILGGFAPSIYRSFVRPNLNEGDIRNRLDVFLIPDLYSSETLHDFEEELNDMEGTDQAFVTDMKARFLKLPLSEKMAVIEKLREEEPDMQAIIKILYAETP